ncbi:IDEAL domain-containing protein [Peribacillus kribbensis]|uniref:IDEAL domain-containing protein n=1 Tax=Peribacillus kribbensis TaxID=356658 RepID=UPI00040B4233|nr:IDEAL domain-containing protein [Peribacillus kribbensis]
MKREYKFNKDNDLYGKQLSDYLLDKEVVTTNKILSQKYTEYTQGANRIIAKVQREFLENRRTVEIDKALDNKDEARFLALTSDGWQKII